MLLFFKFVTLLALIIAAAWAINKPAYDSIGATVTALAAVLYVFFLDGKNKRGTDRIKRWGLEA